ncbi:hypothetical protein ABVT39_013197 [Epinephelus coioides]
MTDMEGQDHPSQGCHVGSGTPKSVQRLQEFDRGEERDQLSERFTPWSSAAFSSSPSRASSFWSATTQVKQHHFPLLGFDA